MWKQIVELDEAYPYPQKKFKFVKKQAKYKVLNLKRFFIAKHFLHTL